MLSASKRALLALALLACSSTDTKRERYAPAALPPLSGTPVTTLDKILTPTHARSQPPETRSPADVAARTSMMNEGFGEFVEAPGEPVVVRAPPAMTPPARGANPKMLLRFVHMPDLQIPDDESPARFVDFDAPGTTQGGFRPQEMDACRVVNAAVRTINALHTKTPISFVLLGGDNADAAQRNEIDWVLDLLGGSPNVECDSGEDDDPIPGPGNDGKDPFVAEGLAMPFYWVTGNHDILAQGNFPISEERNAMALGDTSFWGGRDWSKPGGPVIKEGFKKDANRRHLLRNEVMKRIFDHKGGHGLGPEQVATGKAYFSFDVPDTPLRFVVLDTAAETGGAEGVIHQSDVDSFIKPTLDKAKAEGKYVLLASHHSVTSLGDGSNFGGEKQADALSQDQWLNFLGGYTNVLFSIVGHSHEHRVRWKAPQTGHGYWEVVTSALADFPHQIRMIELWDDDNGWIRLRGVLADYSTENDPVAAEARKLGIMDFTSGWCDEGRGTAEDRNVEVSIPKP